MKKAYPIILTPSQVGYVVYIPDLDINTQGVDVPESIEMARDAIGLWAICEQDLGHDIPEPSSLRPKCSAQELVTLVDVDIDAYRKAHDSRMVRRNITLPSWLNDQADKAGINVSGVTQKALKKELNIN